MLRKDVAKRIGCAEQTLKSWLTCHRIDLCRTLSDAELLAYPEEKWRLFTPHEQLLWVRSIYRRGLDLHDFPLMPTLKRQSFGCTDPWLHVEWAVLMINFGGKTKAEMARRLGVHPSTLTRWANERDEYGRLTVKFR